MRGGRRAMHAKFSNSGGCLAFKCKRKTPDSFKPLFPVTKEWENWFIHKYQIDICAIYQQPYNFERTGCKGCPFAKDIQHELDILEHFFPEERKQCEIIWKPVYDEYRRLSYRLKTPYAHQMTIEEFNKRAELIERSKSK